MTTLVNAFRRAGVAAVVVAMLAGSAEAVSLAGDPNAMLAWRGRTNFSASLVTFLLNADVEFAVYEPGKFAISFPGADPAGGSEYVYAYQIFNLTVDSSLVTELTVELDGDEPLSGAPGDPPAAGAADLGHVYFVAGTGDAGANGTGNLSPLDHYVSPPDPPPAPTLARWAFLTAPLETGDTSDVLLFTSPAGPQWDSATVAGAIPATKDLPSPLPEAASLALLALGAAAMLIRRTQSFP